jgi:hypothetical protein
MLTQLSLQHKKAYPEERLFRYRIKRDEQMRQGTRPPDPLIWFAEFVWFEDSINSFDDWYFYIMFSC